MGPLTRAPTLALILLLALVASLALRGRVVSAPPVEGHLPEVHGTPRFAAGTSAHDRDQVLGALAAVRPEARRILERIEGAVMISVGSVGEGAAGVTHLRDGKLTMTLDLALIERALGPRGVARLVLHEFGHVVDFALTPAALDDDMNALTPRGYGCEDGVTGACADARERFAEGFSKWATGDIGVQAGSVLGYQVPPPSDLEQWGRELTAGIERR